MAKCVFIVQGEGRGHMSQSMALKEVLVDAGHTVEAVYVGRGFHNAVPDYFENCFSDILHRFHSPYFLRTPNRKGIYVGRTLLFNLVRGLTYFREIRRIGEEIKALQPDVVFNFYEVLGALAMRRLDPGTKCIGIGHHFYLHLTGYICNGGSRWHRRLLGWHTQIIMQSCDRVLALSFREGKGNANIEVVPPLIRKEIRLMNYQSGDRFLVYLLNEGFLYDLIILARKDPEFLADVFTSFNPEMEIPPGIRIHSIGDDSFRNMMASCRGLITTAGFDTAAEAAYHGIQLAVIPVRNHYEQECNCADIERNGIGIRIVHFEPVIQHSLKLFDHKGYRMWADKSWELILKNIME